ncbi:MAG: bifunctional 5,10-methylenetetrahydrofolate dehydrogenase/5,10-methenyltetrahydrofolate cyclohydrolase [Peptococcaceae bacterium]|nr:bifunctional 5,10-methylenetetrahydrofolate dehydrogenase/5,10-methenyltetrahydrofolate cyclohydrolase [Peptococcaceae bacterium]
MTVIIDGRQTAVTIKEEIRREVDEWRVKGVIPKLVAILVGDDKSAEAYAQAKGRVCDAVGIAFEIMKLPAATEEFKLLSLIDSLNCDQSVHGIIVELPLPEHIDRVRVFERLAPNKDVDGIHPLNRGYLMAGVEGLFPATPCSCIELLERWGIEICGKHAVVIGRGETVGKPLIFMLLQKNATVTVCHTKTADLAKQTRQADILITAAGKAGLITGDMVRPGVVVIDAGINYGPNGICGDVDFNSVKPLASAITPVPGGVGSLTTVLLLKNLLRAVGRQQNKK